jgi:hypothetical protein
VARTAIVIGGVIVIGYIDDRLRFNIQLAILQENRVLNPRIYLDIAGNINCSAPLVIAQRAFNNFIHLFFMLANHHTASR